MYTEPLPTVYGRSVRPQTGPYGRYRPLENPNDADTEKLEPLLTGRVSR